MRLFNLAEEFKENGFADCDVVNITDDSRKIEKNSVFVCVRGNSFDGHTMAEKALEMGATAIITDHALGLEKELTVTDTREFYGKLCSAWFEHPEKKLKIIGVTGTNGKTTITKVIKEILTSSGYKAGLIGTIQNEISDEIYHTENTTPMAYDFMKILHEMVLKGCEYAVMEVSSFGLIQKRIGTVRFDVGIFTNLTQDHLDYHKTMENYYQAKKLMFSHCDKAIINTDDEYGRRLYNEISCEKYSYGFNENADFTADGCRLEASSIEYKFKYKEFERFVHINMTGKFNIANTLGAISACITNGIDSEKVFCSLDKIHGVKGRCEVIPTGRDFTVICDYAHTPDAIENILSTVKEVTCGKLICLFGCGGNRDSAKRPLMAEAACRFADRLIITSDNPRDEEPKAIIDDILKGIFNNTPYEVIEDRREAVIHAVKSAEKGDIIVLAGKGHEDYQVVKNNEKIHFDEREIVREALK